MSDLLPRLYSIVIRYTEAEPIRTKDLAQRLGISEQRVRQLAIEGLAQKMRIATSVRGFFYCENSEQAERFANRITKHAISEIKHARAAKALFRVIREQEELELQ